MVENDDEETLPEKCSYSELLWSAFSRIWTECGEILRISPYSVRMRENADQNNSEYEHFFHSEKYVNSGSGIVFDGKALWSFGGDYARNVVIFGVDNSSSSYR